MGLFDDSGGGRDDEVVIEAPGDDGSDETRLGEEVESSLVGDSETGSRVDLEDIHSQNETIIDLLEQLLDEKDSSGSRRSKRSSGSSSSRSGRSTDRKSSGSRRVTDRKDSSDDESIGEGMNELL